MEDLARGIFYNMPEIVGIIEAEDWNIPSVNFGRFSDDTLAGAAVATMEEFLSDPYILDARPDEAVRAWLNTTESVYGRHVADFYRRSCILPERFVDLAASLEAIAGVYIGANPDRFEWYRGDVVAMCHVDAFTVAARVAKAYECKRRSLNFLRFLQ